MDLSVRQGDVISCKLFTNLFQYLFERINIDNHCININDEKLTHLGFADDLALITDHFKEAKEMLNEVDLASKNVRLNMIINKTKFMINLVATGNLTVNNLNIE